MWRGYPGGQFRTKSWKDTINITVQNLYEQFYDGELDEDLLRLTSEFSTPLYEGEVNNCEDEVTGEEVICCEPLEGGRTYEAHGWMEYVGVPERKYYKGDELLLKSRKGKDFVFQITLKEILE